MRQANQSQENKVARDLLCFSGMKGAAFGGTFLYIIATYRN
jgi:hypothetical protein